MIQGLNNTINILRRTEGAMDAIGGASTTEATLLTGVRFRRGSHRAAAA